ncbi:MAG: type II secretion system F family protein [Fusobacterium sp.]
MNRYMSLILNKQGKKKIVFSNELSKNDLKKELKNKDQFLIKSILLKKNIINEKEILFFFTKLRIFVESGYQFYDAIDSFSKDKRIKSYINRMKTSLKNGEKIEFIFKNSGLNLKKIDLIILKSGEESGNLIESLVIIENRLKNRINLKDKLKKIMIYPKILMGFILIIFIFFGKFILPNFVNMLKEMKIEISETTILIIWFSDNFYILGLFFLIIKKIFKNLKKNSYFENLSFNIKFINNLITIFYKDNFLEALLILLNSNIDLVYSIKILKDEETNKNFKEKLKNLLFDFESGKSIEESFNNTKIFNKSELGFIKLGEQSGDLINVLEIIQKNNKKQIENKTEIIMKLLEPFTIVIIGIVILFIFKGIYFPLLKIIDNI